MSINGKTIFKIDNNFFIDNTGIRTFTKREYRPDKSFKN